MATLPSGEYSLMRQVVFAVSAQLSPLGRNDAGTKNWNKPQVNLPINSSRGFLCMYGADSFPSLKELKLTHK